jgi:plasmid stabilization system protein ParE
MQPLVRTPRRAGPNSYRAEAGRAKFVAGSYVIIFRYRADTVEIFRIIERHRDIAAQFDKPDD